MCDRDCNQGRRCPARLYPGIGKCADLDNIIHKDEQIHDESYCAECDRLSALEIAIGIAWALWSVLMLFAILDLAAREGFLG